jgi:hypothetical protein
LPGDCVGIFGPPPPPPVLIGVNKIIYKKIENQNFTLKTIFQ